MPHSNLNTSSLTPEQKPNRRDRRELLFGYLAILVVLWAPRPFQRPLYWLAAALLLAASLRPRADRRTLGFSTQNLARASAILLPAALLAAVAIAVAAHVHTLHIPPTPRVFVNRYWGYILWSFAQQFLLQDFFLLRLRRLLPGRPALAVACAASLFAFAHVPSPILTVFTLVWGLAACAWFARYPSLYPLALSHALLGIAVSCTIPNQVTHNMRVGLGYLTYHRPTSSLTTSPLKPQQHPPAALP